MKGSKTGRVGVPGSGFRVPGSHNTDVLTTSCRPHPPPHTSNAPKERGGHRGPPLLPAAAQRALVMPNIRATAYNVNGNSARCCKKLWGDRFPLSGRGLGIACGAGGVRHSAAGHGLAVSGYRATRRVNHCGMAISDNASYATPFPCKPRASAGVQGCRCRGPVAEYPPWGTVGRGRVHMQQPQPLPVSVIL